VHLRAFPVPFAGEDLYLQTLVVEDCGFRTERDQTRRDEAGHGSRKLQRIALSAAEGAARAEELRADVGYLRHPRARSYTCSTPSIIRASPKKVSTRLRAAPPMRATLAGSAASSSRCAASSPGSSGGTRAPVSPSTMMSSSPSTLVPTTARPACMASRAA